MEVSTSEKEIVEGLRQLSQAGRDYVLQKIRVVKHWERFVSGDTLARETPAPI